MEKVSIHSDKRNSKMLIILMIILAIGSIIMAIFGSELRTNKAIMQTALTISIVFIINIIKDISYYKKSLKVKKYINFKKEIISYTVLAIIVVLVIIFVPFSIILLGILGVFASGFILSYEIFKILNKEPLLILKKEVFIDRSALLSIGEIMYTEIRDIFIFTRRGNKELIIVIDGIEEKYKKLPLFKRLLSKNKKYIAIPQGKVDIPLEKLESLICNYANLNKE